MDAPSETKKIMGKITNKGSIDASALADEIKAASRRGGGSKDGPRLRDLIVTQSKLPQGSVRMRVLPPSDDMHGIPWVRSEEHFFYAVIDGEKKVFSYNCLGRDDHGCRLATRMINAGRKREGESWRAKTKMRSNVIFTGWSDGDGFVKVPEEYQGVRIFEFGRGILRGSSKNELGGMLALLKQAEDNGDKPFYDTEEGVELILTKTGKELDTVYKVELATVDAEATVGGRKVRTSVPDVQSLENAQALLDGRHDLQIFLRSRTADEVRAGLEPFEELVRQAEKAVRSKGPAAAQAKNRAKSLQEELDEDIPFGDA